MDARLVGAFLRVRRRNMTQTQMTPIVSTTGLWYGYLHEQSQPGDGQTHQLEISDTGVLGNPSLFADAVGGVALTHRAMVSVDLHALCSHEVAIERALIVQLDKGDSGGLMDRGESNFVAGKGNASYQGLLEAGHIVRAAVKAPGDQVQVQSGYISVMAQPS
jgi:hypothetical protein